MCEPLVKHHFLLFFKPSPLTWKIFGGYVFVWASWVVMGITPLSQAQAHLPQYLQFVIFSWAFLGGLMIQLTFIGPFYILFDACRMDVGRCFTPI